MIPFAPKSRNQDQGKAYDMSVKDGKFPKFKGKKKAYYEALMKTRGSLMEQVKFHTDEALNYQKNSAGERAGMSTHMADLGSDNFRHDLELGLLTNEGDALELVEEAIQRLEAGDFGKCLDCGCKINQARLEAMPYALFCINCKSIREDNDGLNPNAD